MLPATCDKKNCVCLFYKLWAHSYRQWKDESQHRNTSSGKSCKKIMLPSNIRIKCDIYCMRQLRAWSIRCKKEKRLDEVSQVNTHQYGIKMNMNMFWTHLAARTRGNAARNDSDFIEVHWRYPLGCLKCWNSSIPQVHHRHHGKKCQLHS